MDEQVQAGWDILAIYVRLGDLHLLIMGSRQPNQCFRPMIKFQFKFGLFLSRHFHNVTPNIALLAGHRFEDYCNLLHRTLAELAVPANVAHAETEQQRAC